MLFNFIGTIIFSIGIKFLTNLCFYLVISLPEDTRTRVVCFGLISLSNHAFQFRGDIKNIISFNFYVNNRCMFV